MCRVSVILERGGRSYQYVVHIDNDFYSTLRPLIFERLKDVVHHVLEGRGGVTEPEIHNHGFIQPVLCLERGFVLVAIFDAYFVKASFYIELGEDECVPHFCD